MKHKKSFYYVGSHYSKEDKKSAFCYIDIFRESSEISLKYYGDVSDCTTQNEADLIAIYNALVHAYKNGSKEVTIYTISTYVVNAIGRKWIYDWEKNGWKTKQGKDVKFLNIWKKVYCLIYEKGLDVNMKWVKSVDESIMLTYAKEISEEVFENR